MQEPHYQFIKSAMVNLEFANAYKANPDQMLKDHGITDPMEVQSIKQMLHFMYSGAQLATETQSIMMAQIKSTSETGEAFKLGLRKTVEQIDKGFRSTMMMYTVAFYLGVVLVLASLYMAITDGVSLLSVVFGGLGVVDFLGFFFAKPAQNLQSSRSDLAQLQAAYYNWFLDVYNWNSYLGMIGNTGQVDFQKIREVSDILMQNTDKTMAMMEKYCGLSDD